MKTGRRRKKEERQEVPAAAPAPAPAKPARSAPTAVGGGRARPPLGLIIVPIVIAVIVLIVGAILCSRSCGGPGEQVSAYLPATAAGSWSTTVNVLVPELAVAERFRSDCEADPACRVVPGTCVMREREDRFTEQVVDDYDDYAYDIYYEETEAKLYEAAGDTFVETQLNANEDWWDGDRHYLSEEWLDQETCQYTNYTVWITDPEDEDYEVEVVLSECEVWDHVIVKERVYEEGEYCRTESVGVMVVQDRFPLQGTGPDVEWAGARAPEDGELERVFEGTVTFRADGVEHTVNVSDPDAYARYMTTPHYIAVDEDGDFLGLTTEAP